MGWFAGYWGYVNFSTAEVRAYADGKIVDVDGFKVQLYSMPAAAPSVYRPVGQQPSGFPSEAYTNCYSYSHYHFHGPHGASVLGLGFCNPNPVYTLKCSHPQL